MNQALYESHVVPFARELCGDTPAGEAPELRFPEGDEPCLTAPSRPLGEEPIVRLIRDGTVVRVRLDRQTTSISLLVVIGVVNPEDDPRT